MASVAYTRRIYQRKVIDSVELAKWQRYYAAARTDLYADPEIQEACERLFDRIEEGRILVREYSPAAETVGV